MTDLVGSGGPGASREGEGLGQRTLGLAQWGTWEEEGQSGARHSGKTVKLSRRGGIWI